MIKKESKKMFKKIKEGQAEISVPIEEKISKDLPVFYNPVMKFNRDMSVILLNAINMDDMQIALPLAGTGVRGARFLTELKQGKAKLMHLNDMSKDAVKLIIKNLKNNFAQSIETEVFNLDANDFLLQSKGFDYIDIDPFGSPNHFLDSSIKRLSRCGILAVTATDTSALCGTFPKACQRKYWAVPSRTEIMHEAGLRILIRKVQLIGAQFDRALTPVFSYSKDHYMRIFFKSKKGKQRVDEIFSKHSMFKWNDESFGPLWTGQLWDVGLVEGMLKECNDEKNKKFLELILQEAKIDSVMFFDIHSMMKRHKVHSNKKKKQIIDTIHKKGFKATQTHFSPTGIRTDMPLKDFLKILKK